MLRSLFSPEHTGNLWFALSMGLLGFILSYGLARAGIIPSGASSRVSAQVVVQAPLPPPPPPPQRAAPGCPV